MTVVAPVHERGRVTGVRFHPAEDASAVKRIPAALVVDCSGRGSRTPVWLREWGYEPPAEEAVKIGIAYTSAYFRRHPGIDADLRVVIGTATPAQPKPYVLIAQEPDADGQPRWVMAVGGYEGDHVAVSLDAIQRRLSDVGSPEITAIAQKGEIIGAALGYKFPQSERRRYERLRRFPPGFLVMGDAIASFNPVYGQGMTVAALEAIALRDALASDPSRLGPTFFKAAAKVVDTPWQLAVGSDLSLPQVPGPRPLSTRLINAYVARVQKAAVDDPQVAAAFVKVMHMLAPPASLFAPSVVSRVLRHHVPPAALASSAASPAPA